MDLNLFNDKEKSNNTVDKFVEELKKALTNTKTKEVSTNEKDNVLDEYNIYERKKVFLDNKSRKGNDLAWVMDGNSVCISENGDGGPTSIKEVELPDNAKVGDVYEKVNGEYVYNSELSKELNNINK